MEKEFKTTELKLPAELMDELDTLCSELKKEKSQVVIEALNMYLDYHDLQLAVEKEKDPNDRPLTSEEFFEDLDI